MGRLSEHFRIAAVEASHIGDLIRLGDESNLSPWNAEGYLGELRDPNSIMFRLVSAENEIVGFIVGRVVLGGQIEVATDAEIYNIAVSGVLRGQGLGQSLLDAFIERAQELCVANIWLEVRESNAAAVGFYSKNGFEPVQTRRHFYDHPREHAILMKLALDPRDASQR